MYNIKWTKVWKATQIVDMWRRDFEGWCSLCSIYIQFLCSKAVDGWIWLLLGHDITSYISKYVYIYIFSYVACYFVAKEFDNSSDKFLITGTADSARSISANLWRAHRSFTKTKRFLERWAKYFRLPTWDPFCLQKACFFFPQILLYNIYIYICPLKIVVSKSGLVVIEWKRLSQL